MKKIKCYFGTASSGKTYVLNNLKIDNPWIKVCKQWTTRKPRSDDQEYGFFNVNDNQFLKHLDVQKKFGSAIYGFTKIDLLECDVIFCGSGFIPQIEKFYDKYKSTIQIQWINIFAPKDVIEQRVLEKNENIAPIKNSERIKNDFKQLGIALNYLKEKNKNVLIYKNYEK